MKRYQWLLAILLILAVASVAEAQSLGKKTEEEKAAKAEKKRDKLDQMADATLDRLFEESPGAKDLYNKSYGYAVFDNRKTTILITTGGGKGIAVERNTGNKAYMRMASAGLSVGIGLTFYQVVFLFEGLVYQFCRKGLGGRYRRRCHGWGHRHECESVRHDDRRRRGRGSQVSRI